MAVRLIVERERERDAFKQEEYWSIDGEFTKDGAQFAGALIRHAGKKVEKMEIKTEADAKAIVDAVSGKTFVVGEIIKKKVKNAANAIDYVVFANRSQHQTWHERQNDHASGAKTL